MIILCNLRWFRSVRLAEKIQDHTNKHRWHWTCQIRFLRISIAEAQISSRRIIVYSIIMYSIWSILLTIILIHYFHLSGYFTWRNFDITGHLRVAYRTVIQRLGQNVLSQLPIGTQLLGSLPHSCFVYCHDSAFPMLIIHSGVRYCLPKAEYNLTKYFLYLLRIENDVEESMFRVRSRLKLQGTINYQSNRPK